MKRWTYLLMLLAMACHSDVVETPQDPGLVELTGALGEDLVRADVGGEVLARLRITGASLQGNARPPFNLSLVLDTSGSMRGEAIDNLKAATSEILSMLRPDDRISIVTFGSEAKLLLESQLSEDVDGPELAQTLGDLEAEGTTALAEGLNQGFMQVRSHQTQESIDWIVLLGDGVPNDPNAVWPVTQQAAATSIHVAALGLGLEYDEVLMGEIATRTQGVFEFIEEPNQVASVFRENLLRLNRLVARGATLSLRPGPGVELIEIVGHPTQPGGGALQLSIGDLAEGETREFIARVTAPGKRAGAFVELIDADLRFTDPIENAGALRRSVFLGAEASASEEAVVASRNEDVFELATRMQSAVNTVTAVRLLQNGQSQQAQALLEAARGSDSSYAELADSIEAPSVESGSVDGSERPAPRPAPARNRVRRAHDRAMQVLGY